MTPRRPRPAHRNGVRSTFAKVEGSRNDLIVKALDLDVPMRLRDIAEAVGHDVSLMSAHMRSLLKQGRVKQTSRGRYVRVDLSPTASPSAAA